MSIGRHAAHGVAWYLALGVFTRLLGLGGSLVLARWIMPADYGPVITASIVVLTANAVTSFAFGQCLIATRAPAEVAIQAAVMHVGLGVVAATATYGLRDVVGELLGVPQMGQYVLGYALALLIIDRLRYVPERLLVRALRFRALATINGIGEITLTATALGTAPFWGPYALVVGALARSLITAVLFLSIAPHGEWLVRLRLRIADVRRLFTYGLPLMVSIVTDSVSSKWDNLVVSRLFNAGVMANYNFAYNLADMPMSHVAEHIGEVLMPSFSRMGAAQQRVAAVRTAGLMSLIVTPVGVGLGAIAPTIVDALFTESWAATAPMLMILSVMMVTRPMTWSALAYAQAVQRTHIVMASSIVRVIVVIPLVAVGGVQGGPNGACVGAGLGFGLHTIITLIIAHKAAELPLGTYLRGAACPLLPGAIMFIAVVSIRRALEAAAVPLGASLVVQITSGAVVYVGAAFVLARASVDDLLRLCRDTFITRTGRRAR
ncbi:MAG TPA: oligosaccharide flippase family protein [Kofleriaceae bacterium]|jgi:PST family polysaccharide transporter|nr:oligosaccharide flippase family protein [Kofleriaceae bacterium]